MFRRRSAAQSQTAAAAPASGELTLRSMRQGGAHVVALGGELDVHSAQQLDDELARVEATDAGQVVVDLRDLTLIDSVGMSVLINATHRARGDGRLAIVRGCANVHRPFELSGLASRLPFVDSAPGESTRTFGQ